MKHSEIYDKHTDRRKTTGKPKKMNEADKWDRKARVSFKNYVREIRNSELEEDLDIEDDADLSE